jgi:hypothetical protein
MPAADADAVQSDLVPRVATFFARYPERLGLEDGTYYCLVGTPRVVGFPARIALHLKEGSPTIWLDPSFHENLFVSVRFHRGRSQQSLFDQRVSELTAVVKSVAGDSFPFHEVTAPSDEPTRNRSLSDDDSYAYSVVEMTTPLVVPRGSCWEPGADSDYDHAIGPTLTRCIDGLIEVVNAYRFAEKIVIPSPARERIGPDIIAAIRPADPEQGTFDTSQHIFNVFAWNWLPARVGGHTNITMTAMSEHFRLESIRHPIITLMRLQAELESAFYHDGNFISTIIFAHSASEVILDLALMGMFFEEGRTPEESAAYFNKPLKARLLNEYHERIRGSWGTKGAGTVAVWLHDVLLIRHRVVHSGYTPRYEEANAAQKAYFSLGTHLRDRLAASAKKYPFTAGLLVRKGGFERRSIQTKAAESAVRAADERLSEFMPWRTELISLRA